MMRNRAIRTGIPVLMQRDTLIAVPGYPLPPGFRITAYRRGDDRSWLRIHLAADLYNRFDRATFRRQFGDDAKLLAARQLFLLAPDGSAIGTVTAWFRGAEGRIHWLAIEPSYQGRGLAKPLLEAACHRLAALGHGRAYLTTATNRLAAINLYAGFGFRPVPRNAEERSAWSTLAAHVTSVSRFLRCRGAKRRDIVGNGA